MSTSNRSVLCPALLALFLPQAPEGKPKPLTLKPFVVDNAEAVPIGLRSPIVGEALPSIVGRQIPVRVSAKDIKLDLDSSGRFSTTIARKKPETISIAVTPATAGDKPGPSRTWLVAADASGFWISPADGLKTAWQKQPLELLDGNADGNFGDANDWIRFGNGSWHRFVPEQPWVFSGEDFGIVSLAKTEQGFTLKVDRLLRDSTISESQWRALTVCNEFRTRNGLPPMRLDPVLSDGCQKHALYLQVNNYDYRKPWDGVGAHDEDPKLPGYTKEGQAAAQACSAGSGGDPASSILVQVSTMLHRASYLGDERAGLGVGSVSAGARGTGGHSVVGGPLAASASLDRVIVVPAPGATDVSAIIKREVPGVERDPAFYDRDRGYPISVTFGKLPFSGARIRLFDARGVELPGVCFSRESPIHSTRPTNADSCFFVADKALESKSRFEVEFTGRHQDRDVTWRWSFSTR